ncbi:tyrosine-type recombinase/integrase, partial [Dickeya dianthicola]
GIRRGEVAVLEVYSVDASRHIVTIVQGKGKKDRVIPVGQRVLRWLAYYLQAVRPQLLVNPHCPALFVALDGIEGLTPNGITNLVSHYIKASGIAKWGSCHLFRHAMATQMLENGAD